MEALKRNYSKIKLRYLELFYRAQHAINIFKMRFIPLIIPTHIHIPENFVFEAGRAKNQGYVAPDGNYYSAGYALNWQEIPDVIRQEIKKFDAVFRLYFGGDYLINEGRVWRNRSVPDEYKKVELYGQLFHYDHVVDYRNIQLFVLLTDTTEDHGPLEYVRNSSTKMLIHDVEARNGVDLIDIEIGRFTGGRGDAMLFATGCIPHRASIPKPGNHRDIFSIAFFPKYTGIGLDAKLLFDAESK